MDVKAKKIIIRGALKSDIDALLRIEKAAWGEKAATQEMLVSRMMVFPEGFFCATKNGKIQGFAVNEIINYHKHRKQRLSWANLTDNGFLTKSHDSTGDSLYGVSISVPPSVSDKNVAKKLYEYGGKLAIKYRLKKIYLGSRIPSYLKYASKLKVEDYVYGKSSSGRPLDPELALYLKLGLKIEKIIPDFFDDPESLNYGVIVSWSNAFYPFTKRSKKLAELVSNLLKL
ncbi:MAG: hypothetical protein HQ596_08185 [Candidatus Saganbacteria bacterium]|nr:hypothetical protein [Candidatus Saganbacteria bacterium]